MRFWSGGKGACGICKNPERSRELLAIVAQDTDLLALERSHTYRGMYFVLGGTISLASEKTSNLRLRELMARLATNTPKEIILAFPANPEGDATSVRIREEIQAQHSSLTITALGRGLSTGSELEYADLDTIKSALDNRK
jgi:recombination protein RecR